MVVVLYGHSLFALPLSEIEKRIPDAIEFKGLLNLSADHLTEKATLIAVPGKRVSIKNIRSDVENLYKTGLLKEVTVELDKKEDKIILRYVVVENELVKKIEFAGNNEYRSGLLLKLLETSTSNVLDYDLLEKDISVIKKHYISNGYSLIDVRSAYLGEDGVLVFNIDEGFVSDISIEGNDNIDSRLLLRELYTVKGKVFNTNILRRDREKLVKLGYFNSVSAPQLKPAMGDNAVDVVFNVKERKFNTIGLSLETNTRKIRWKTIVDGKGLNTIFSVKLNNQLGMLDSINFKREYGVDADKYRVDYFMPWIDRIHISLGLGRWYETNNEEASNDQFYDVIRNGGEVVFGLPFYDELNMFLAFRKETVSQKDFGDAGSTSPNIESYEKNSIGLAFSYDTRDSRFNPSKGTFFVVDYEKGGDYFGLLLGGLDYSMFSLEYSVFKNVTKKQVLGVNASYSVLETDADNVLENDKYKVGGTYTVRGFDTSNDTSGYKRLMGNLECRFKVSRFFSWILFYDVGVAYEDYPEGKDVLSSVGAGLRFITPIGPLRFDLGYPNNGKPPVLHFGLSEMF